MAIGLPVKMLWSVWDNNSTVCWEYNGQQLSAVFKMPPVSVAILPINKLIVIVGNYDEFGSDNLQTYDYQGKLQKTYQAPNLGGQAQFGGAREIEGGRVETMIGYLDGSNWKDTAGILDLNTSAIDGIHRSY